MAEKFSFPSDRQPWLDPDTGLITRPWFLFLQNVFSRLGGATGTGNTVLDAQISELQQQVAISDALAPALAEQAKALQVVGRALDDANVLLSMADVPSYELAKRVSDLETLGAFVK